MIESDLVEEGNWPNKMHLRRTKLASNRELTQALQGNKMLSKENQLAPKKTETKHSTENKMHSK